MKKKANSIGQQGDKLPIDQPPKRKSNKRAERYLRQPGDIEDLPSAGQQAEAEKVIRKSKS